MSDLLAREIANAHASPERDEQQTRSIIIAIWPKLQRGRWDTNHTRDLDDHGDKPNFRSVCTGSFHNAARAYSQHTIRHSLAAQLHDGTWAVLTHDAYQTAYLAMTSDEQRAHYASLTGKRTAPYRLTTDRTGNRYVSTNRQGWDTTWARHARAALDKIAAHTITRAH